MWVLILMFSSIHPMQPVNVGTFATEQQCVLNGERAATQDFDYKQWKRETAKRYACIKVK